MTLLGTAIVENIVHHYGTSAFMSRLADPFWFQALGSVMGMDWHSSGITTSVLGALKRGLNPHSQELGSTSAVAADATPETHQMSFEPMPIASVLTGIRSCVPAVSPPVSTTMRSQTDFNSIFTVSL
jgi:hypothetical protein